MTTLSVLAAPSSPRIRNAQVVGAGVVTCPYSSGSYNILQDTERTMTGASFGLLLFSQNPHMKLLSSVIDPWNSSG